MDKALSSFVLTDCAVATGSSFTSLMVIAIVADADVAPSSSVTVNVKLSLPLKLLLGVYVKFGAVPVTLPLLAVPTL